MRMSFRYLLIPAALLLALPSAVSAQTRSTHASSIGVHAYTAVDLDVVAASQTFDATVGTSHFPAYGGGVDITDIWKHVFARVAVTHLTKKGTRVFVDGGQVFSLGIPLTLTMTPIEAGGGWRFASSHARITPYAGASALAVKYSVTYKTDTPSENESATYKGGSIFGGAEFGVYKWIVVGAEGQYRFVPNALGKSGVSQAYNETDLGGVTARVTIGVRIGR